jgi:16S rRNA (adenine1518-N6/adenine1519-N6)-dimethyltransferase
MKTKKQFGQHWLRNEQVLDKIIKAAQLKSTDRILEIGPGTGILTRRLIIRPLGKKTR